MTAWIRWQGFAAFTAFCAFLSVAWWLLIDAIVLRGIEKTGTALVGARVDLGRVDVSLWPAGIVLYQLEITDPEHPMSNAIEIERIAGLFDGLMALRRKLIVDELAVEGVRFGTPRERSGAIRDTERATPPLGPVGFELPAFDFPDPEQILAEEELESVALIRKLRVEIEESVERWKRRVADLPGEDDLKRYRRKIEELGGSESSGLGRLGSVAIAVRIIDNLRRDLAALKEAASDFEREQNALQERVSQALAAPARDLERLRERYGLSAAGLANLGGRLLGARIHSLVAQSLEWYRRLEPVFHSASERKGGGATEEGPEVVERVRGRSVRVRFREEHPLPDFLIRHAEVSIVLEAGAFSGTIDNITPDQPILGRPLTLAFAAEKLSGIGSVKLEGEFDHVRPDDPADSIEMTVRGFDVEGLVLSESESWPISIDRGSIDLSARVNLEGESIRAVVDLSLVDAAVKADFPSENLIADTLAATLEGISAFTLGVDVSGTVDDYEVKIRSDLDRLLGGAVKSLISGQVKQFEARLESAIQGKMGGPLSDLDRSFESLSSLGGAIKKRLESGQGLLTEAQSRSGAPLKGFKLPGLFQSR